MKPKDFAKIQKELEEKFTPETVENIKTGKINQEELAVLDKEREYDLQVYNASVKILQPYFNKYEIKSKFGRYDSTITVELFITDQCIAFNGIRQMKDLPRQMMYCTTKTELADIIRKAGNEISSNTDLLNKLNEINDKFITEKNQTKKEKLIIDTIRQKAFRFHLKKRMQKN